MRRQGHVADLVEKNGALVALLEFADPPVSRAGERALFVAEQFALQKILGNRGAVDRQERLVGAAAVMVNGPRHQLLARPAFARNQHGRLRLGYLADKLEDLLHRLALADDALGMIFTVQQRLIADHLAHVARGLESGLDQQFELGHFERLEHVVVRARLHRLDGCRGRAVGGHHNDQQLRV